MDDNPTVFGISSVFLMANLIIMILLVYINTAVRGGSIDDIIKKKMSEIQEGRPKKDSTRNKDFDDEIKEEKTTKGFIPSQDDVYDLFTIGKPKFYDPKVGTAFRTGFQSMFKNMSLRT